MHATFRLAHKTPPHARLHASPKLADWDGDDPRVTLKAT